MYTAVQQQFPQHQQGRCYEYHRLDSASTSSESDDIDDILSSLWPTTRDEAARAPLALLTHGTSNKRVHGGMAQWNSGQCTPPDDHPSTRQFPGHTSGNYSLFTPVSCSIQIGDPEWRVDSPPAVPPGLVPMVEPISPPAHCGYIVEPLVQQISPVSPTVPSMHRSTPTNYEGRGSLGLGGGQPANRSVSSLGLFRSGRSNAQQRSATSRILTPEERVARLQSVSGLAARAVARRCLSGQVQSADLKRHLQTSTIQHQHQRHQLQQHTPAEPRKPTFADIARGK